MTITEKILARHAGRDDVKPGEIILASVDIILANDVTAPVAIDALEREGIERPVKVDNIVLVPDHFAPNKDIKSAQQCMKMRRFAHKFGIKHYYEVGKAGIEHALLPEEGLIKPGMLIIGADSHTCTYGALGAFGAGVGSTDAAFAWVTGRCWFRVPESVKIIFKGCPSSYAGGKDLVLFLIGQIGVSGALYKTLEFTGEAVKKLPAEDRLSMCNMAIEAGAKNGIIEPDGITAEYTGVKAEEWIKSDKGCAYADAKEFDITGLAPQVAFPSLPSNTMSAGDAEKKNVRIDQVVIGSCTNGRISDLRAAAGILKGRKVSSGVRLIVIPGTQKVYLDALKEGLLEIFIKAGGVISPPTCGPCLGGHMGILAEGERALSTTNRNFTGRMGHPKSEVYLCNPVTAAAGAVAGRIISPENI